MTAPRPHAPPAARRDRARTPAMAQDRRCRRHRRRSRPPEPGACRARSWHRSPVGCDRPPRPPGPQPAPLHLSFSKPPSARPSRQGRTSSPPPGGAPDSARVSVAGGPQVRAVRRSRSTATRLGGRRSGVTTGRDRRTIAAVSSGSGPDDAVAVDRNAARFLLDLGGAGGGDRVLFDGASAILGGSPIAYQNAVYSTQLTEDEADRVIDQ